MSKKGAKMKKLKLSLSICMMCLCVAVLCMGILVASSATYNINGNISYNMIDGIALVNTRVYKVAEQKTTAELQTAIDGTGLSSMTFETIEQTSGYILSQKLDTKATLSENATQAEISSGSINITFGATDSSVYYYTYYIVINITNLSSEKTLSATLTDDTTYTSVNYYTNTSQSSIAKGETKNIVIGLSLSDTTVESLSVDIKYILDIEINTLGSFNICSTTGQITVVGYGFTIGVTWSELIGSVKNYSCDYGTGNIILGETGYHLSNNGYDGEDSPHICSYAHTSNRIWYDKDQTTPVNNSDLIENNHIYYYTPTSHVG